MVLSSWLIMMREFSIYLHCHILQFQPAAKEQVLYTKILIPIPHFPMLTTSWLDYADEIQFRFKMV